MLNCDIPAGVSGDKVVLLQGHQAANIALPVFWSEIRIDKAEQQIAAPRGQHAPTPNNRQAAHVKSRLDHHFSGYVSHNEPD